MKSLKKFFVNFDASNVAKLSWRVFANYYGSEDCAKLSLQERALIIRFYHALDKDIMREWKKEEKRTVEMLQKKQA